MKSTRNRGSVQGQLGMLRREREGSPPGYVDRSGEGRAPTGNEQGQYAWVAPFQEGYQEIGLYNIENLGETPAWPDEHQLPVASYDAGTDSWSYDWGTCFPAVDVADYRVISLLLQFVTEDPAALIEIVPVVPADVLLGTSVLQQGDVVWRPLGFVNPNPTATVLNEATFKQSFAMRTIEPMMFRSVAFPNAVVATPGVITMTLDFEVASYERFTCSFLKRNGGQDEVINTVRWYMSRRV